jgi:hypothetical protein
MTLEADLAELGWVPAENVPCMWRMQTADNDCLLGTIVDDLFFSEKTGHAIADATCEALRKKYVGVTSEHNPKAFAGYKIEQSPERDVITISMPELIGQKFAQECPELITTKARDAFKLKHVKPVPHRDSTASAASSLNPSRRSFVKFVIAEMSGTQDDSDPKQRSPRPSNPKADTDTPLLSMTDSCCMLHALPPTCKCVRREHVASGTITSAASPLRPQLVKSSC